MEFLGSGHVTKFVPSLLSDRSNHMRRLTTYSLIAGKIDALLNTDEVTTLKFLCASPDIPFLNYLTRELISTRLNIRFIKSSVKQRSAYNTYNLPLTIGK